MRARRASWAGCLLSVVAVSLPALTSCDSETSGTATSSPGGTSDPVETSTKEEIRAVRGDPEINVHDLSARPDMMIGGTLRYRAEDRCLTVSVVTDVRKEVYTPVWPVGTKADQSGKRRGVRVPGFGQILDGDDIEAGGDTWDSRDKRVGNAKICPSSDRLMIFNPGSFKRN